jgi:predicted outer membrane repeat protein
VNFDGSTGADFTIMNTRFIDNSVGIGDGGAIATDIKGSLQNTAIMTVDKSTFTGNYAGQDGGAINHDTGGTRSTLISVTNSTFSGNTAESDGGAMDTTDAAFVSGNRFVNNTALFDNAGALQLNDEGQTGRSIVTKNSFENNAAGVAPGFNSVTADGGAIEFDDGGVVITNNVFTRNRAVSSSFSDGGAIEGSGYDTTLSGNSFLYNSATGDGGAVYFSEFSYDYAKSKITGNTFDSNAAGVTGGALWIDDNEAPNDFKAQISDNRIVRNTAQYGAGLYITLAAAPKHLSPTGIVKNIFERNIAAMNGGAMMIEYYGGAYRDARVAQQALLKATKNNRYVANKANLDRSTAIVGGLNVGFGPFIDAADEAADPEEAEAAHHDANVRVSK